jgi:hypothetical protein
MQQEGTQEDEFRRARDEARCEASLQTLKDVLWRFEETDEGTYSIYDLIGYLVEDLVKEGCCAACIQETVAGAFDHLGVDVNEHRPDEGDAVLH